MDIYYNYEEIPISEFNDFCRNGEWKEEPRKEDITGYGEPYRITYAVWGVLADGRKIKSTAGIKEEEGIIIEKKR